MNNYTFYDLIEKFEYIEIPALQRDYAQGRREAEEIRSSFLSYLKGKLISEEKDTLDFIYGTVDEKLQKLVLIDGQQRLTTLFLLYWYLATTGNEQNREEFQLKLLDNGKSSRFRYATRSSSKEFCNALASRLSEIDTSLFSERPVSEVIIDQKWFQKQWINDSTVKSMLNMLDAMQNEFAPCDDNLYPRLQNVFSVDFLNLNDFSIHEAGRLYIKMNSRGKPLTRFENLKTKLLTYVNSGHFNIDLKSSSDISSEVLKGLSLADKIGWLFDIRWTDAIWSAMPHDEKNKEENLSDSLLDRILLNLVVLPIMNECCVKEIRSKKEKTQNIAVDKSFFSEGVEKLPYDSIFDALHEYDKDGEILGWLFTFLNDISTWDSESKEWRLRNFNTYGWLKFGNLTYFQSLFSTIKDNKITLADILKLHAIYLFFRMYGKNFDCNLLKEWLRFSANVIEASTYILSNDEFIYSLDSLTLLCEQFPLIDRNVIKDNPYRGLDSLQIEEEVEKKRLAGENSDCRAEILLQEEKLYDYFEGQLRYPFSYSGLWRNAYSPSALDKFRKACGILHSIFVKPTDDNLKRIVYNLLTRALLTKTDEYMVDVSNRGVQSLLVLNHRDYSWKRFLKNGKNDCFSELMDDLIAPSNCDISSALEAVITNCNIDALPSWRKLVINNPRIMETVNYMFGGKRDIWEISRTGTRNIMIYDDYSPDAWVVPIKGRNCANSQSELFSLDVYTKICDPSPFKEIVYRRNDINDKPSCAVLNEWQFGENNFAIDIARIDKKNIPATFSVRFFDRNDKEIPSEIKEVLLEFSMNYHDGESNGYCTEVKWKNDECIVYLKKLLLGLKSIVVSINPNK